MTSASPIKTLSPCAEQPLEGLGGLSGLSELGGIGGLDAQHLKALRESVSSALSGGASLREMPAFSPLLDRTRPSLAVDHLPLRRRGVLLYVFMDSLDRTDGAPHVLVPDLPVNWTDSSRLNLLKAQSEVARQRAAHWRGIDLRVLLLMGWTAAMTEQVSRAMVSHADHVDAVAGHRPI